MLKKSRLLTMLLLTGLAIAGLAGLAATAMAAPQGRARPRRRPLRDLQRRVAQLEQRLATLEAGGDAVTIAVDCSAGQTVNDALAQGAQTWGPLVITISGTCRERVAIRRDDTTLRGANPGDGLDMGADTLDLIVVEADRVGLHQLTLRTAGTAVYANRGASLQAGHLDMDGGYSGVYLSPGSSAFMWSFDIRNSQSTQFYSDGAAVEVWNCVIEDGHSSGFLVSGGTAELEDCTIQRHASWGLSASDNASLTVYGTGISENSTGLYMTTGASGTLGSGTRLAHNTYWGVQERDGSVLYLGGGVSIDNNPSGGVLVSGGSFVLPIAATISNNGGTGISLRDTSLAGSWNWGDQPVIQDNGGWGVFCAPAPAVAQVAPSGYPVATVTGNTAGASNCPTFGDPTRVP